MIYIFLIWYAVILILFYVLIIKRLKFLSNRQAKNTWIKEMERWFRKVEKRMIPLLIILYILCSLLFLTFIENDILHKKWFHLNEKTLDHNDV